MDGPGGLERIRAGLDALRDKLGDSYKATVLGMWACSELGEVYELFQQVDLARFGHMADLGSGDGRAVLVGSLFTRATGIEVDPELVSLSRGLAGELGLERADFIQADCRQMDLSPFDFLYIYPDKPLDWLEPLLAPGWPGRLLVYGPYFKPQGLVFERSLYAGTTTCGLWRR